MPTFETPEPISVTLEVGVGDIRIVASDRTDTVVDVRPSDPAKKPDVTAAEQTRVEYANGRLLVKAPKGWRQWSFRGGGESIDVEIELPAGSHVGGEAGVAALRCNGRIGECRYKVGVGDIQLDQAGPVQLKSGAGDITRGTGRRRCRDQHGFRRRGDRQHRRRGGGQELQRRHVDRRGHGRRAGERGQRQDLRRPGATRR